MTELLAVNWPAEVIAVRFTDGDHCDWIFLFGAGRTCLTQKGVDD